MLLVANMHAWPAQTDPSDKACFGVGWGMHSCRAKPWWRKWSSRVHKDVAVWETKLPQPMSMRSALPAFTKQRTKLNSTVQYSVVFLVSHDWPRSNLLSLAFRVFFSKKWMATTVPWPLSSILLSYSYYFVTKVSLDYSCYNGRREASNCHCTISRCCPA
jgi:hypothetical protein